MYNIENIHTLYIHICIYNICMFIFIYIILYFCCYCLICNDDIWYECGEWTKYWKLTWSNQCACIYMYILLLYSNTMRVCLRPISFGTAGPIWLKSFLFAPSWSGGGFWPKTFWIQDSFFAGIRKTPDFRVLFDQFGWNLQVILTLT